MSVRINQYTNLPILLAEFSNDVTIQDMETMVSETLNFSDAIPGTIYRVFIFEDNIELPFERVIQIVKWVSEVAETTETRVRNVIATPHPMARLLSDMLAQEQFGQINVPVLRGLGEALIYVQEEIDRDGRPAAQV